MKSKRCLTSFTAAFLAMGATCSGQRGLNWRVYKAADGLPESAAVSVTIGPHSHLWVRHPNKEWVGWLDGYDVKVIPSPGPGNSRIYESSGQIWSFTAEGLEQYKDKESGWIHFATPEIAADLRRMNLSPIRFLPMLPSKLNHDLLLLPERLMDCNTETPGQPQTTLIRAANQTGLQRFSGLTPAHDGGLWITGAKGIAKVPGPLRNLKPETQWQEHLVPETLQMRNLRDPVEDNDGGITALAESFESLGNIQQLTANFDGQTWTAQPIVGERLTQAWRAMDKTWWGISFHSLYHFKPGQKQLVAEEELSPLLYYDAAVETNGVFWLATSDGLFRYAPLPWRAAADAPGLDSIILALIEDQAGRLWVVTTNSLHRLQNEVWTSYPFPAPIAEAARETRALFPLTNGTIVLAAGEHLVQFNSQTGQYAEVNGFRQTAVKPLGQLKDGKLCVLAAQSEPGEGTYQLALFDGHNFIPFPFPQPDLNFRTNALFLFASQNGNLLLSGNNGLAWFHDNKWQNFPSPAQAASLPPTCIVEISDGKIWCGDQDKVLEFDGKTWTTIRAGFYRVNALLKGHDGSIWVASDNGLHRFDHGNWTANSVEEGLPNATVRGIYEDRRGQLWAGTARGLTLYHPNADLDPPRTSVQNLPERNNTVREGAIVTIAFSGQDKWKYTADDRLLYSYSLDAQEWSLYQEQRSASFLDLPAGKHSFHVRSMDRNWNVDPTPAVLEFTVALPWYRESRLLFISFTGLAVAIFFAGLAFNRHRQLLQSYAEIEAIVALRTKQLEQANQELFHSQKMNALGTLAAGIAHDFNNILSIIKGSAQIIEDNLDNQAKIRTRTDRIKTVVEQGAGIVKAMLGFSRGPDRNRALCNIDAIVQETITLLGDRFLREVEVRFTPANPPLPEVPASKDFIQQILLNFIFNAAEASTGHRQVVLSTAQTTHLSANLALKPPVAAAYVLIMVKDFGSGIAPEIMPRIFEPFFTTKSLSVRRGTGLGLSMVYELARQMDCGLGAESAVGKGSVFTLIIPVRDLALDASGKKD